MNIIKQNATKIRDHLASRFDAQTREIVKGAHEITIDMHGIELKGIVSERSDGIWIIFGDTHANTKFFDVYSESKNEHFSSLDWQLRIALETRIIEIEDIRKESKEN